MSRSRASTRITCRRSVRVHLRQSRVASSLSRNVRNLRHRRKRQSRNARLSRRTTLLLVPHNRSHNRDRQSRPVHLLSMKPLSLKKTSRLTKRAA